jgi:hypothetical protein
MNVKCPLCGSDLKSLSISVPVFFGKNSRVRHYYDFKTCVNPSCKWYVVVRHLQSLSAKFRSLQSKGGEFNQNE